MPSGPCIPVNVNLINCSFDRMSDLSSLLIPRGFRFGATVAGIKASGRPDFSLIVADAPASAAVAFTSNRVIAAPLIVDKRSEERRVGKECA